MKITKRKIISKLSTIGVAITLLSIRGSEVLASGIGTAEMQTATDNIKRVITSIAMPLGRSAYFCKCSYCCNKNDCKC